LGLFGKSKLPLWDPAEGNPHVAPAVALASARDWPALAALARTLDPSDRFHMIQGLGGLSELDGELSAKTDDPVLASILGGIHVSWAWRHRGGARANEVSSEGAANMRRCLLAADALLTAAGETAPEDTTIIAWHLRCEMGLGGDFPTLVKLTHRLSRSPEANIFAALAHLNFVTPKWHGSIDQMWAVANAYAGKPHNAAWVALAARAHVEEWLFSFSFGDDRDLQVAYSNKLSDPGFREFVGTIDALFWKTLEANGPMSGSETVFAHNNMAALLVMVNAIELSRAHFERIGRYVTEIPLGYFTSMENLMEALNHWRRRASLPPLKA
jgi:hypothetical protein